MNKPRLHITMIGTGYVGLVSGTCFAEMGFDVTCVDIDKSKIEALTERGEIPIYEPGLEEMVKRHVADGRLKFTTDLATTVPYSDAVFIAVGTPQDEDGSADMKYVLAAAKDIATHLKGYTVIVNKSTVPVGTAERVKKAMRKANSTADFDIVSNPEFLREGNAVKDFLNPDRVVVGASTDKSRAIMTNLYRPLTNKGAKLLLTDTTSSEMIKYAANSFLAVKITFINEIAALCDVTGANVQEVSLGMGMDSRIGEKFLQPGPGYGGSCFPKDTSAIARTARDFNVPQTIVERTIKANEEIKKSMVARIINACGGSVEGKTIAALGIAFKAGTDDTRDAPALTILPLLQKAGATIKAYDPEAIEQAKSRMPTIIYCDNKGAALKGADAALILTEWPEFKDLDLTHVAEQLTTPVLIDLRNLFEPEVVASYGLIYYSIGRPIAGVEKTLETAISQATESVIEQKSSDSDTRFRA